jgi:hypothetical protein
MLNFLPDSVNTDIIMELESGHCFFFSESGFYKLSFTIFLLLFLRARPIV